MCLLKVYVEDEKLNRRLIAQNVAFVSIENGSIKLLDVESRETTIMNVEFLSIDSLNSTLMLKRR